jgi:hypothetical protein
MEGESILRCFLCDISEVQANPTGYFNPVTHIKCLEYRNEKIFYIDHSTEHVPSPG